MEQEGRFALGQVVVTVGAMARLEQVEMFAALQRHVNADWGELTLADRRENDAALNDEGRLLSAYLTDDGEKFWVITEADRSSTTILLPEEY